MNTLQPIGSLACAASVPVRRKRNSGRAKNGARAKTFLSPFFTIKNVVLLLCTVLQLLIEWPWWGGNFDSWNTLGACLERWLMLRRWNKGNGWPVRREKKKMAIVERCPLVEVWLSFTRIVILWFFLSGQSKSVKTYWQCSHHFD